jgi:hypothetical protein
MFCSSVDVDDCSVMVVREIMPMPSCACLVSFAADFPACCPNLSHFAVRLHHFLARTGDSACSGHLVDVDDPFTMAIGAIELAPRCACPVSQ